MFIEFIFANFTIFRIINYKKAINLKMSKYRIIKYKSKIYKSKYLINKIYKLLYKIR
jgi:hypothetical protein